LLAGLLLAAAAVPAFGIAGGRPVTADEFAADLPWVVLLTDEDGAPGCTGTLVAPRYVLTAAHCAREGLTVHFGSPSRAAARRIAVREVILHPGFTRDPITHDLALLRLAYPPRTPSVPVATRAEAWDLVRSGTRARIAGWGTVRGETGRPDLLHAATLQLAAVQVSGTHLALESPRGGPCGGDSGGPLLVTGQDGVTVLVGVASVTGGNLCAAGGGAAGYTHVAALGDFLRAWVPGLPERLPPLEFGLPAR